MPLPAQQPSVGEALYQEALLADEAHCRAARVDFDAFVTYVMREEGTGNLVEQRPMHSEWSRLLDERPRLLIWAHIESGKTTQIAVARTLWELGRNPNLRFLIVSRTSTQAEKIGKAIRLYIETSDELHRVFPKLRKAPKPEAWTDTALTVRRKVISRDPSVQCCGVESENVLGSRLDRLILDDALSWENTYTKLHRDKLIAWYKATLEGRLVEGARVRAIGTAWHPEDLYHHLATQNFKWVRFPIRDEQGNSTWPERWPEERIAQKERDLGPLEAPRQLHCIARDDATARFKAEWIIKCLELGKGLRTRPLGWAEVPAGCKVYTGVDLAVSKTNVADLTAFTTILLHPNRQREVVNIESGRMSGPEIVARIIDHHKRYKSIIIVETNAAQAYILQFTREAKIDVPVQPFVTGKNKADPDFGIEALATELSNGQWIIPSPDGKKGDSDELDAWINEMLYYSPTKHTGDRLMSSWFCVEAIRRGQAGGGILDFARAQMEAKRKAAEEAAKAAQAAGGAGH